MAQATVAFSFKSQITNTTYEPPPFHHYDNSRCRGLYLASARCEEGIAQYLLLVGIHSSIGDRCLQQEDECEGFGGKLCIERGDDGQTPSRIGEV
jgi:hypothetical protein